MQCQGRLSSLVAGLAFVAKQAVGLASATGLAAGAALVTRLAFVPKLTWRLVCQHRRDRGEGQKSRYGQCYDRALPAFRLARVRPSSKDLFMLTADNLPTKRVASEWTCRDAT